MDALGFTFLITAIIGGAFLAFGVDLYKER